MPNGPISVSGVNRNSKRIQGFKGSRVRVISKQVSNFEQGVTNYEVFSFDIHYSLFDIYPPIFLAGCGGFGFIFESP
jgi:hypothetical protein